VVNATLKEIEGQAAENNPAIQRLVALLGPEHAGLLAELLATILEDTGYGGVEIVVADRRVQTMKLTKSYRARKTEER
jgi:hypothetical protein